MPGAEQRLERAPQARLFFALWPPPSFCERLEREITPMLSSAAGRLLSRSDWHVTLCFLGAVPEPAAAPLCERASILVASAFELVFDRLEHWRAARLIAATATHVPEAASELAHALAELARELGLKPDVKPLKPHVTLMRSVARIGQEPSWPALSVPLAARRFALAESVGAAAAGEGQRRYRVRADWPLSH